MRLDEDRPLDSELASGDVGRQALSCRQQLLFVHYVVAVEYRPCLVASEQHRDSFGDTGPDQVPCSGSPAVVEQSMRHVRLSTGVSQRRPPGSNRDAVAMKHEWTAGAAPPLPPFEHLCKGRRDWQHASGLRL